MNPSRCILSSFLETSLSVQPGGNVHAPQLLEQQFRRIRQINLTDLVLVVAVLALERVLLEFGNDRHQPTDIADMHSERIRDVEQALLQE